MPVRVVSSIRRRFQRLSQSEGQVTHVLLTRSPLFHPASWASSFDLHVLSTPPAFVLSQDQTLRKKQKATHQPEKDQRDCEFDLTKTNIILTFIYCPKRNHQHPPTKQSADAGDNTTTPKRDDGLNNWHLTIKCTLLSSQGPDTTRTQPTQWFSEKPIFTSLARAHYRIMFLKSFEASPA